MLVLSRKRNQTVIVTHIPSGDRMTLTLVKTIGPDVRLGFTGGKEFAVFRGEVQSKEDEEQSGNRRAADSDSSGTSGEQSA